MKNDSKPQLFIPNNSKWNHAGDTFREIAAAWGAKDHVEVKESPDRFVWWGSPGEVLLYDHPRLDTWGELPDYKLGLFGNMQPDESDPRNNVSWIFWARNPAALWFYRDKYAERISKVPRLRYFESSFMGKVENQIQFEARFQTRIDWSKHIQIFNVVKGAQTKPPAPQEVYFNVMTKTKFGLLLPGFGPKCNRDIEVVGLGAIPLVTPGVNTDYYDPWKEGRNYLRMHTESDLQNIFSTSNEKLEYIQNTNFEWFKRNCTLTGSFETTKRIIEENL